MLLIGWLFMSFGLFERGPRAEYLGEGQREMERERECVSRLNERATRCWRDGFNDASSRLYKHTTQSFPLFFVGIAEACQTSQNMVTLTASTAATGGPYLTLLAHTLI